MILYVVPMTYRTYRTKETDPRPQIVERDGEVEEVEEEDVVPMIVLDSASKAIYY